jgi:hypothetical protein
MCGDVAMFELRRERHSHKEARYLPATRDIDVSEVWIDADVLVREDGLKLICIGRSPHIKNVQYRYAKAGVLFDFFVNREHWGGTVTGTCEVVLSFRRHASLGTVVWPLTRAATEDIVSEIDAGLRAWPPSSKEAGVPLGVILFHVAIWGEERYTLLRGQPLALRHDPPWPRWSLSQERKGRPYEKDRAGTWINRGTLIRDDGVKLTGYMRPRGPGDDGPGKYHYVDRDVGFDFEAERCFSLTVVTDTWEVTLAPHHMGGLSPALRERLGRTRCVEIIHTIEEALYAWPLTGHAMAIPVNRIVFLDAEWTAK